MRRAVVSLILALFVAWSATTLSADSRPTLSGVAAGIELCPQFICGFALFAGQFQGEVNSRPASGFFTAALTHEDLPTILETSLVTGGVWKIATNRRVLRGQVAGGTLVNLDGLRFCVNIAMDITEGGNGRVYFNGVLDHNPFPPTIAGLVTQEELPPCAVATAGS